MKEDMKHPDPFMWWFHRRMGNYLGVLGIVLIAVGVFTTDVSADEAKVLVWCAGGCLLLILSYGPLASLADVVSASRWGRDR